MSAYTKKYAPRLKQFFLKKGADRNTADDLVQKIFTSLWQQRKNYSLDSSFEAYLYSMARNVLYKEIQRSHRINELNSKKQLKIQADTHKGLSQPEAELYFHELSEALEVAKTKLTNEQYQALEIFQARGADSLKASEDSGCSKEAYKKRLKRARKRIMEFLAPYFTDKKRHEKG